MPVQLYKPQRQVFQFRMYDIGTDDFKESRRWATREFIEKVEGLVMGRAAMVDEELVSPEGLTERNFDSEQRGSGFQAHVR